MVARKSKINEQLTTISVTPEVKSKLFILKTKKRKRNYNDVLEELLEEFDKLFKFI